MRTANGTNAVELGMTLRDYFAAAALNGYLASWPSDAGGPTETEIRAGRVARVCYALADAMLAERAKS